MAEAVFIAALNWFLGVVVDRQDMSLAGLDPSTMATSSKIGGIVFGLYFALCALVALLVAIRDRAPAGFGRVLLISAAVVHALLGAFAWGLVGWTAFLFMVVVLGLIVLLLMTYDRDGGAQQAEPGGGADRGGDPRAGNEPAAAPAGAAVPAPRTDGPQDGDDEPQDSVPAQVVTRPAPTTP
ncbi:membrane protein [Streptomyces sp. MMG1121]|nr:membrane protein [Streptomyces sp. MMG1121]